MWYLPWARVSLQGHQRRDREFSKIIQDIESNVDVPDYRLVRGILCKRTRVHVNPLKICLPQDLVKCIIQFYHDSDLSNHQVYLRTLRCIGSRYTWSNMASDICECTSSYQICHIAKRSNERHQGLLVSKYEKEVNGIWYRDTFGPLSRSKQNYKYCLIVVDGFSRRTYLEPLRSLSSQVVIGKLSKLMTLRGYPAAISRDNASIFTSGIFKDFFVQIGNKGYSDLSFSSQKYVTSERYVSLLGNV